jgi:isochorismate hydrolase
VLAARDRATSSSSYAVQSMKHIHGLNIPQTLDEVCDPERMALVVYDMQVGILNQIKNPETIVTNVSRILQAARAAGVRTFFMRHMSLPKELMGAFSYRIGNGLAANR